MKTALLEIEAILANAIAQLPMPNPNAEKAKLGVEVVYLGMAESQCTDSDAELFSILSKEHELQAGLERARKNN